MNKGLIVGITVVLAAILVAGAQFGFITQDPNGQAIVGGAVGALFIIVRAILKKISFAGWGWKTITAGAALLVVAGCDALGFKIPAFVVNLLTMWGSYALGDTVGLLKPAPKG
jgi:hypothetical protein